jgi:hypothetical protein
MKNSPEVYMHRWLTRLILAIWLAFPTLAFTGRPGEALQDEIQFGVLQVQLWPEYDQPSMLVIHDFELAPGTPLPARVSFEIPLNANLIAVAALQNGNLVNAKFEEPAAIKDVKVFTIIVESQTGHHFEYYQPLARSGSIREFMYTFKSDYAVDEFSLRVQQPLDTTALTTDPPLKPAQDMLDGLTYYANQPVSLPAGTPYSLELQYEKTSDALTVPSSSIQPSEPLDENITGRISAGDYWPYIIAVVGFLLIAGGAGYYYMTGRIQRFNPRRRARPRREAPVPAASEAYCHQCGQRAHSGDRFCRVCGTRLRHEG